MIKHEHIAQVAHEVNRAFCNVIGDTIAQLPWAETSDQLKNSVIAGVKFKSENPGATPEDQHNAWLSYKEAEGWKLGPEKDEQKKEHPNMKPYSELSSEQRAKDDLFHTVTSTLLGIAAGMPAEVADDAKIWQRIEDLLMRRESLSPIAKMRLANCKNHLKELDE